MAKPRVSAGDGLPSIRYVLRKSREAGGPFRLWKRLRSRNACKTCAFGMGGETLDLASAALRDAPPEEVFFYASLEKL